MEIIKNYKEIYKKFVVLNGVIWNLHVMRAKNQETFMWNKTISCQHVYFSPMSIKDHLLHSGGLKIEYNLHKRKVSLIPEVEDIQRQRG